MHWFCAVPLGGLCVSDTASIIFHALTLSTAGRAYQYSLRGGGTRGKETGVGSRNTSRVFELINVLCLEASVNYYWCDFSAMMCSR